jgi:AraC-like DNA-binding protein
MRKITRLTQQQAVGRAVTAMREHIAEPRALDDLARMVMFSPYYFHRVFRAATGVPPAQFLLALRMSTAYRLLLTTQMRVRDVCVEVGFESLGTFTTRFTRVAGAPPQQLRCLATRHATQSCATLCSIPRDVRAGDDATVTGWIDTPTGCDCIAMLGLSQRGAPHGLGLRSVIVRAPGPFSIESVPAGRYQVIAVGVPPKLSVIEAALLDTRALLVNARAAPVACPVDHGARAIHVRLRAASAVDPPVVLAAPILAAEHISRRWQPSAAVLTPVG